jgi:dTDP-4-dehydrorhamnose 3,5-epimerase
MKVIETDFEGLILFLPRVFQDERGEFYESWRQNLYQEAGIKENLLQDNISFSKKNVLRGLHYQKNQGQLLTVTYGKIFDVVVDIRPESKTYKQYYSMILDSKEVMQLYMPPGFAHGFFVLSDLAILHYKCSQYYDKNQESGIIWNDPEIGIKWPELNPIISSRDLLFQKINE